MDIIGLECVQGRQFVKEWFARADLNNDSLLSFDESRDFLPKMNSILQDSAHQANNISEKQLKAYWDEVDVSGDGTVDLAEFKKAVLKYASELSKKAKIHDRV